MPRTIRFVKIILFRRNYFSGAKHISVPGRMFPVKEIYLEEILVDVQYSTPQMEKMRRSGMAGTAPSQGLEDLTRNMVSCQGYCELSNLGRRLTDYIPLSL